MENTLSLILLIPAACRYLVLRSTRVAFAVGLPVATASAAMRLLELVFARVRPDAM